MASEVIGRFEHYPPNSDAQIKLYKTVRRELGLVAEFIDVSCPDGREKSLAITKLEEAMFWANAAIARKG